MVIQKHVQYAKIILCVLCALSMSLDEIHKDKIFYGASFRKIFDIGWNMCVDECRRHADCQSVNYDYFQFKCLLNRFSRETCPNCDFISKNGYYYRSLSSEESLSTCASVTCPSNHKCITLKSGSTKCIRTECVDPALPNPVYISNDIRAVGQRVPYNCDIPFYKLPSSLNPLCSTEGEWDYASNICACRIGYYKCHGSCCICPVGHYTNTWDAAVCLPCPVGSYQSVSGRSACYLCGQNKYQDQVGQTSCKLCPEGQYQNQTGESFCYTCDPGTSPWRYGVVGYDCTACFTRVGLNASHGTNTIETYHAVSEDICAQNCEAAADCMAFTHTVNTSYCELHSSQEVVIVEPPDGAKFYKKMC